MVFQMVEYVSKQQAVAHLFVCLPALGVLIDDEFNGELDPPGVGGMGAAL